MDPTAEILKFSESRELWQQDALRRLAVQGELTDGDREQVLSMLKAARGLAPKAAAIAPTPQPLEAKHLPDTRVYSEELVLKGLSDLENVNNLKSGENLEFNPTNLTLIYGDNGSGKSGYVRVLKHACGAPGAEVILANVFAKDFTDKPAATAKLHIVTGSDEKQERKTLDWRADEAGLTPLHRVRVFDSRGAGVYVADKMKLAVVPFNLDLLDKLAANCDLMKATVKAEDAALEYQFRDLSDSIPDEGNAKIFVARLTAKTTGTELDAVTTWEEADEERLLRVKALLEDPKSVAAQLRSRKSRCDALNEKVAALETGLSTVAAATLRQIRTDAADKRAAADDVSQEAFASDDKRLLPGVGGGPWRVMWEAARNYSTQDAYPGRSFPVVDADEDDAAARCVLCQQDLATTAVRDRLRDFEAFVKGEVARKADEAEAGLSVATESLDDLEETLSDGDDTLIDEIKQDDPVLASSLRRSFTAASPRKTALVQALASGDFEELPAAPLACTAALKTYSDNLETAAVESEEARKPEERDKLEVERSSLLGRKTLAAHRPTLDKMITNRVTRVKLAVCRTDLSTWKITATKRALSEAFIGRRFEMILQEELEALRVTRKVTFDFDFDKAVAYHRAIFRDSSYRNIEKVLSEGEHRAVALACFLAETRMLPEGSPVVIDDPISSLDDLRRERVAKRLVREAKERQLIVFTHDMVFLTEMRWQASEQGVTVRSLAVEPDGVECGKVAENSTPWQAMSVKDRLALIEHKRLPSLRELFKNEAPDYEERARNVGKLLRDTWERLVEEDLFYETVVRWRKSVETGRLSAVTVEHNVWEDIDRGVTRTSNWTHDVAAGSGRAPPEPEDLEAEIRLIRECRKLIVSPREMIRTERRKRLEPIEA